MTPHEAEIWIQRHLGKLVRRRNGEVIYAVRGFGRRDVCGRDEFIVHLERMPPERGVRRLTWAPISDIKKFIQCYPTGREIPMHEDRQCDTTSPGAVATLAEHYTKATLKAALKARRKIDAEAARVEAEIRAEREENQRLRQIALDALEARAQSGDVGAAVELHRLVS